MIHTGSRGLGYQICDDYLALMVKHAHETGIELPGQTVGLRVSKFQQEEKIIWPLWRAALTMPG